MKLRTLTPSRPFITNSIPWCYERTRDQGTLGSIAIAIVEPLGGHLFKASLVGSARDRVSRCHVMDPLGAKTRHEGSRDLAIRRFYIKLGCYLLDRSFVLNSNSILIYWYSFTSNELYFQV
jgi:hypothetical protein